jgi:DNA-binding transcriptional LysR family regulator
MLYAGSVDAALMSAHSIGGTRSRCSKAYPNAARGQSIAFEIDCFLAGSNGKIALVDRLQNMKVFVQVAQHASFAAAARNLRISSASASKHVAALESEIGTRLFDRTTRRVGLTEAGRVYLERCIECLQALEDADASVSELARQPKGSLRVTAPIDFGEHLMPVLADVMTANPHLAVNLALTNRVVDMVEEGIDVGVRVAGALDGRYVARPLARTRLAIFGAPAYLEKFGRPQRPEDLTSHQNLVFAEPRPRDDLVFSRNGRQVRVKLSAMLTSNSAAALQIALHRGLGLLMIPSFVAYRDVMAGTIEPVLGDWTLPDLHVFAVYPHRRLLSPKVKVFVEALRAAFGDGSRDPWWPTNRPVGRRRPRRGKASTSHRTSPALSSLGDRRKRE